MQDAPAHTSDALSSVLRKTIEPYCQVIKKRLELPVCGASIALPDAADTVHLLFGPDETWIGPDAELKADIGSDSWQIPDIATQGSAGAARYFRQPSPIRSYARTELPRDACGHLGFISVMGFEPRTLTQQETRLLERLADLIGAALRNVVDRLSRYQRDDDRAPESSFFGTHFVESLIDARLSGETLLTAHVRLSNIPSSSLESTQVGVWNCLRRATTDPNSIVKLSKQEYVVCVTGHKSDKDWANDLSTRLDSLSADSDGYPFNFQIGISRFPLDSDNARDLVEMARESALQISTDANGVLFWSDNDIREAAVAPALKEQLSEALDTGDLDQVYQPILDSETNTVVAYECLARWNTPDYGPVNPAVFVPLCETNFDMRRRLSRWALTEALCALHQNRVQHGIAMYVNIAGNDFSQPDFCDFFDGLTLPYLSVVNNLVVEITEGSLITNFEQTEHNIRHLQSMGVRVALDDFGSGYSSLAYLSRMPADIAKLDREFLSRLSEPSGTAFDLTRDICELVSTAGLSLVIEGVETPGDMDIVKRLGCSYMQGFYFGRPMPLSA